MKITKSYLNKLIKEEYSKILSEGIGPGGSFIGRNASAGRRHPGGYGSGKSSDAESEYNEILNSKASLETSDFQKITLLQDFIKKYENAPTEDRAGNWVMYAKNDLEDIKKRIERSGSPIGKMANWAGDQGKKLAVGLGIKEETATTKKNIREGNMKITKNYLKQIIKEELNHMEEAGYIEKKEGQNTVREVSITLNGKTVNVSFSEAGGSPLYGGDTDDLTDEEMSTIMRMASAAAEMKSNEDYSEEDIKKMMSGGKVSPFKEKR